MKQSNRCVHLCGAVPNHPLVVKPFIEIIKLSHVQGPENNIKEVGYYLRADGPFVGKDDYLDPDPKL
jgi:hypothetical protein